MFHMLPAPAVQKNPPHGTRSPWTEAFFQHTQRNSGFFYTLYRLALFGFSATPELNICFQSFLLRCVQLLFVCRLLPPVMVGGLERFHLKKSFVPKYNPAGGVSAGCGNKTAS